MLDFLLSLFILIIACVIGHVLGDIISNYFMSKSLEKSIFSKNDFENIDDDFFSDSSDTSKSITDIHIDNSNDNEHIDYSNENEQKFF